MNRSSGNNRPQKSGGNRNRSRNRRRRPLTRQDPPREDPLPKPKSYALEIFNTFDDAKGQLDALGEKAGNIGQLNILIRAEGNMDDIELNGIENVKVFAGAAWTIIHERRLEDGWYNEEH